jgi:hypothetical protein
VIVQFVTLPTGITYLFLFKPETLTACISHIRFFQVLYFGDSLCSDSFPANNYAGWDVVLVLEEMEAEGYHLTPKDLEFQCEVPCKLKF